MQLMAEEIKTKNKKERRKEKKKRMEESDKRIKATAVKKSTTHQDNLKKTHVKLPSRLYINTLILVDIHSLLGTAQKTKHNRKQKTPKTNQKSREITVLHLGFCGQ